MLGGMLESRLALSANVHLAYACDNIVYHDLDTCMIGHLEDPICGGIYFDQYMVHLTDAPGIGASVDPTVLEQYENWVI